MSRFFASMIALPLMFIGLATTPAKADIDQKDRADMQQVIEQYIKNNPEVLRDALVSLAEREEAERVQAGIMLVRNDDGDPVMGNPNGGLTVMNFPTIIAAIANACLLPSCKCLPQMAMSAWLSRNSQSLANHLLPPPRPELPPKNRGNSNYFTLK